MAADRARTIPISRVKACSLPIAIHVAAIAGDLMILEVELFSPELLYLRRSIDPDALDFYNTLTGIASSTLR